MPMKIKMLATNQSDGGNRQVVERSVGRVGKEEEHYGDGETRAEWPEIGRQTRVLF